VSDGDDERRRLERDLHDGIQQQLLALGSELLAARAKVRASGDGAAAELEALVGETAAVLEEVRTLAHGVYPAILRDAGLTAAVASLTDLAELPIEVVGRAERRYSEAVETAAYHVIAETVDNAVAHSGAAAVTVTIDAQREQLVVEVHDDGRGGAAVKQTGGLAELVDRVGAIDGKLSVTSGPEIGTTVSAWIPCAS
jgi:signal transduction histidine kinase